MNGAERFGEVPERLWMALRGEFSTRFRNGSRSELAVVDFIDARYADLPTALEASGAAVAEAAARANTP